MRRPRGMVLLLALVALVGAAVALLGWLEAGAARELRERRAVGLAALAEGREALLGYALRDANRPGELPCPDFNRDGVIRIIGAARDYSGSRCRTEVDGVLNAGWLPWRTLGLPPLTDGYGESLWYVVGPAHHANAPESLNSDTPGELRLGDGEDLVALLIAPGPPLEGVAGQAPRPAEGFDALLQRALFLEGENGDGDVEFAAGEGNDLLLPLERARWAAAVERRVAAEAAALLSGYRAACGRYPEAAPFGAPLVGEAGLREGHLPLDGATPHPWGGPCPDGAAPLPPTWMSAWGRLLYFAVAPLPCTPAVDCLRVVGEVAEREDVEALVIVAGPDRSGSRPSTRLSDYLEGENATIGDDRFEQLRGDDTFNDRLRVVAP